MIMFAFDTHAIFAVTNGETLVTCLSYRLSFILSKQNKYKTD